MVSCRFKQPYPQKTVSLISFGITGVKDTWIPLLPEGVRVNGQVSSRDADFDGELAKLHHIADSQSQGDAPNVVGIARPVRQYVAGISDAPPLAEKVCRDWLKIHLIWVVALRVVQQVIILLELQGPKTVSVSFASLLFSFHLIFSWPVFPFHFESLR